MLAGATRGKGGRGLSRHLSSTTSGQVVRILENRHLDSVNVRDALRELVAGSAHGRTDRPVHHIHVDPPIGAESEALFDRWCELYEHEFGLQDAPRIAVEHEKKGRRHRHYVYSLVDDNGRVVDLSWEKARREKISRIIEHEFGLPFVPGRHNKAVIKALRAEGRADVAAAMETAGLHKVARPSAITPEQRHQAERTGIAPKEIGARALMAWKSSDTDTALEAASAAVNIRYAMGDKGPVIVDETGAATLATRLLGAASKAAGERIPAAVIKARLAGLHLPPLEEVRRAIREAAKQPADGQEASAGVEVPAARETRSEAAPDGPGPAANDLDRGEGRAPGRETGSPAPRSVDGGRGGSEPARPIGRREGAPRPDRGEPERTAAAARQPGGPRRGDQGRARAVRQAQRLAAVARLSRMDVTGLRAMLEKLAIPPEQRIQSRLNEIASDARARIDEASRPPEDPLVLRHERAELEAAKGASVAAFNRHTEAVRVRNERADNEPRGLFSIITLARLRWRSALDAAEQEVKDAKTAWDQASDRRETATATVARLEKQFAKDHAAEEDRTRQQATEAKLDLAIVREANALLHENPRLARYGLADLLDRARERLDEQDRERHAREAAERRRDIRSDVQPSAPKFR